MSELMEKRMVIFGAGMVAAPAVEELAKKYSVVLLDANGDSLEAIEKKVSNPNLRTAQINAADQAALARLVGYADIVISFLPAKMHIPVAEQCIYFRKPLVTASYASPEMRALDTAAKKSGVLLLNECGLDPGIDHMSAMKMFDEIHAQGGIVKSFESYCGGLPSTQGNNPWDYQLSWTPRGVLVATKNPAQFLRDGKVGELPEGTVFQNKHTVHVPGRGDFEAYYNRDCLSYISTYGLDDEICGLGPEGGTFIRGTLRYDGWCESIDALTKLGFLDTEKEVKEKSYASLMHGLESDQKKEGVDPRAYAAAYLRISKDAKVLDRLEWLGVFSDDSCKFDKHPLYGYSALEAVVSLVAERMQYEQGQTDLVVLQHKIVAAYGVQKEEITATLILEGIPYGDSAMAQTVGLPVAYAADLIAQGKLPDLTGVQIPTLPRIYTPILERLDLEKGIAFREKTTKM